MPRAKKNPIRLDRSGRNAGLDSKVRQFVRDASGDPRLSAWEENFLVGLAAWVAPEGPGAQRLTAKQWTIMAQITAKIAAPLGDTSAEDPEDLETAPEDPPRLEELEPAW
jgi:hypothetical protein